MRDLHNDNPRTYWSRKGSTGFMIPNINNPYVYLNSLFDDFGASRRVGAIASNILKHYENFHTNKNIDANGNLLGGNLKEGLDFLLEMIKITLLHELNFINNKINKMKKLGKLGSEEERLIKELEKINSGEFDYKSFIELLNTVITGIEKYKLRLKGFLNKKAINLPQLNLIQNADSLITTMIDLRTTVSFSQEELIRQLTFRFFEEDTGKKFILEQIAKQGIDNIAATIAFISVRLALFIYDSGLLEEYNKKEMTRQDFYDKYIEIIKHFKEFEELYNIETLYNNNTFLQELKEVYGITQTTQTLHNKRKNNKMANIREVLRKEEKTIFKDRWYQKPSIKNILKHIKILFKPSAPNRQVSDLSEFFTVLGQDIISYVHLGKLKTGTDIVLGTFEASSTPDNQSTQNNPVTRTLKNIKSQLVGSYQQKDYLVANTQVYEKELNELDKLLNELGHGFILHETTKNYSSLEQGNFHNKYGFTGRQMKISNYIKAIELMDINNLNIDEIRFITFNLATDALGNNLLDPLQSYLSIFGGLIMFDDFSLMAREFTKNLKFSNIDNLHLYLLQNTYFPASMFLEATYNSMKNLENKLLLDNGFTVSIDAPTINYYEKLSTYGTTFELRWAGVRDYAEKNTEITLHFGQNFLNLMAQLFK